MDTTTVSICIGLATVLTSGVASSFVTYRLNRAKDQVYFMRQKAEDLYLTANEFGREFGVHLIPYLAVAKGELDYNQLLDSQIENPPKKNHGGVEKMIMLVSIYFPEIEPNLRTLLNVRDRFSALQAAHKQAYKDGEGVDEFWFMQFTKLVNECSQAVKGLEKAIVKSARRHAA